MKEIMSRWGALLRVVFDPWAFILLLTTIGLAVALFLQSDRVLIAFLTVLVSLSSGILGGVVGKRWEDITAETPLRARGKAAIRSLKILFAGTAALERRARLYLSRYLKGKKGRGVPDLVSTYLEEVIERCGIIEEEVLSSIENWTDIIPEADVKSQIGMITDLKLKVDALNKEIKRLTSDLSASKGGSQAEIDRLKAEKAQKEQELAVLRQDLTVRALSFGPPLSSGTYQPGVIPYIPSPSGFVLPPYELMSGVTIVSPPATGAPSAVLSATSAKKKK